MGKNKKNKNFKKASQILQIQNNDQKQEQIQNKHHQSQQIEQNQQQQEQISNIDVSFLIAELNEIHYHSLKTVLQRFSALVSVNSADIASLLLENKQIGNVSVADDDDDQDQDNQEKEEQQQEQKPKKKIKSNQNNQIKSQQIASPSQQQQNQFEQDQNDQNIACSVVSLIFPTSKVGQKMKSQVQKSYEKYGKQKDLKSKNKKSNFFTSQIKTSNNFTFLINQRVSNMPPFIAQSSHKVFVQDFPTLKQNQKFTNKINKQYLISISQVQIEQNKTLQLDDIIFLKFEEYEFAKRSCLWWVGQNCPNKGGQKIDLRKFYFIIKIQDYFKGVQNLSQYLQEQQQKEKIVK